ncbi:ApeA N-terminal domain 1-containing protein [Paenibacillus gallinarum]|uniref:ApeA N-terminal domain-containing protein n=1 Tax=Paenibacillus gallinarum TaxID=2762232 RepID=A0ABR8T5Q5_9BACL|nr:HEPN domain-containing protein [Paenibacillus gallinarum]MBD7971105.1 hypothetical protein [Paenibacillus gallinarum]
MGDIIKGQWWVLENEELEIGGWLEYNEDGTAILNLNGHFDADELLVSRQFILGRSSSGRRITLLGCSQITESYSEGGYPTGKYLVKIVFDGTHFRNREDIGFRQYQFTFNHFDNWVDQLLISTDTEFDGTTPVKTSLSFEHPKEFEIANIDGVKFFISFSNRIRRGPLYKTEINLSSFITLESESKLSLDDFLIKYMSIFQNFLTLAMGHPTFPQEIAGILMNDELEQGADSLRTVPVSFKMDDAASQRDSLRAIEMTLPLSSIKEDINDLLREWFKKSEQLNPIYNLFFSTLYNKNLYKENKFLNMVQALESYHRRRYGKGEFMEPQRFQLLKKELYKVLEQELSLEEVIEMKQKFSHMNEMPLRQRLQILVEKHRRLIEPLFEFDEKMIGDVVITRNYLTHWDERYEKKAIYGRELAFLTEKITHILEICLLDELGLSEDNIIHAIKRSQRFTRF